MRRRGFVHLGVAGASALAVAAPVVAQQARPLARIGMMSTSLRQRTDGIRAFRDRLKDLGYSEGRQPGHRAARRRGPQRPDTRIRRGPRGAPRRRHRADRPLRDPGRQGRHRTIPIVFTGIGTNFPLARSEGNLTGVAEELILSTTSRLALLKEAMPDLARVGVIGNSGNYGTAAYLERCRAWAATAAATILVYDLRDLADVAPVFAAMAGDRVEPLIAFPDSVIFGQRDNIVQAALRHRLPGVYLYREWVAAGGLLAYGPNQASILGGPLPDMVDRILQGARPSDLPVEHGRAELFVNRATAQAMRIDLPRALLSRADEVMG